MFVNTLPLRNYPLAEKTFKEFVREVRERTLLAFENQDYLFEDIVEKLVRKWDLNRNPLFDSIFVVQNLEVDANQIPVPQKTGININPFEMKTKISKFDISFYCKELGEKLAFTVEYCTKLFNQETINRFIGYFKEIVSQVVENNDIKLKDIIISLHLLTANPDKYEDLMEVVL
jgi:non-ribosomal peptide synthetase component F